MLIYMRRYGMDDVTGGQDEALVAFPVPADSTVVYFKGECHLMPGAPIDFQDVALYGAEAWLLQSDTAGDFFAMNTLWDSFVPKDASAEVLDDVSTVDVAASQEIGLINVSQLFEQEVLGPERAFQREKMISLANRPTGFATGTNTFFPTDQFQINISKKYRVSENSGLLFGVSSPDMLAATANNDVVPGSAFGETEAFYVMRYLSDFIQNAMVAVIQLFEAGAESPYEELMDFIQILLEDVNTVSAVGAWTTVVWTAAVRATCGIKVPGSMARVTIGPDAEA